MTSLKSRLQSAQKVATAKLLAERNNSGYWEGELSTSALSTATACMAMHQFRVQSQKQSQKKNTRFDSAEIDLAEIDQLIQGGVDWIARHQNDDGGWGDTVKSFSNISTTMLCHATLVATSHDATSHDVMGDAIDKVKQKAERYIEDGGGIEGMIARYGKDQTFSVPILTHCALAGLVSWKRVPQLPFELACFPQKMFKFLQMPVVSYALPALIAIGQVRFHQRPGWNPVMRGVRNLSRQKSLRVLDAIQPPHGGFLEAAPLTSFVMMSLCHIGLTDHIVVQRAIQFLKDSVRDDGSWPIDTNLATWVTTLATNGLTQNENVNETWGTIDKENVRNWLLNQQYKQVHPFTNADPGGWAWTDLPGGVPDADDTPGTMLALMNLDAVNLNAVNLNSMNSNSDNQTNEKQNQIVLFDSLLASTKWLLDLQNRDGGFPTFCRGWGTLPFDRSSCDITAHALRALFRFQKEWLQKESQQSSKKSSKQKDACDKLSHRIDAAMAKGFRYLKKQQRSDGSWLPLWFGNQYQKEEENPIYGTARVLRAYADCGLQNQEDAVKGAKFLYSHQNNDFGWGGMRLLPSSVEETAVTLSALADFADYEDPQNQQVCQICKGAEWLISRVEAESYTEPTPIGFYFAKLWYFERLYPQVFLVEALGRLSVQLEK